MAANNRSELNKDLINGSDTTPQNETSIELLLLNIAKAEKAQIVSDERINRAKKLWEDELYKVREQYIKDTYKDAKTREEKLKELKENAAYEIYNVAKRMEENAYKFASVKNKHKIMEERREYAKTAQTRIRQEMALKATKNDNGKLTAKQEKEYREKIKKAQQIEINTAKQSMKLAQSQRTYDNKSVQEKLNAISQARQNERDAHQSKINDINEEIKKKKEALEKAKSDGKGTKRLEKQLEKLKGEKEEATKEARKSDTANFGAELKEGLKDGLKKGLGGLADMMVGAFNKGVDDAIESVGQNRSFLEARLQGTQSSYDEVAKNLKKSLAVSPYVKQTEVLQKLRDAVDKGIAYNVEQRAFLATMTDKIVSTFDAFDSNLMRIIRLQQADTTAARMGMEAELLQFFNSTFSDNSYLQEGYDDVSKALVDANAQMTRDMSVAFEYNVQKWMGSLASLGFGTETITKIATGINYLGSGNVAALASDTQLQSLLAMSASRAGLSYSDLLVKGIDDSSVNVLLKSMVEYLAEIASDDNAVVKAAYGDVFNFTQSDLRAIKNIANDDGATIKNIFNSTMTYNKAMDSIQSQLNQVGDRLSMTEMIDNAFANFLYTAGESIGNSAVGAITWKMLGLIDTATGGDLKLPEISYLGTGINITSSIPNLIKTGIFGLSALGQIGTIASSLRGGSGLELGAWGFEEYTKRGGNFESTVGGVQSTKSGSKSVTSSSSSDAKEAAIASTEEDQEAGKKRSKEAVKDEITLETLYKEIFEKKSAMYVLSTPIEDKLTQIVATDMATKTIAENISRLMYDKENPMYVIVKNLPDSFTSLNFADLKPKDSISITNTDKLATAIGNAILGTPKNDGNYVDGKATLADIANILLNGTIQVIDRATEEELKKLSRDFY